jgi:hypothetical protein
LHFD